ncbi:hypothetical protein ABTX61_08365 [Amycolatopsis japonica]|uniref:hypothetical protein n=1 Tax=Amycolatopsis japonica TaxID=208439 RepID=UPI00332DA49A
MNGRMQDMETESGESLVSTTPIFDALVAEMGLSISESIEIDGDDEPEEGADDQDVPEAEEGAEPA